MPLCRDPLVAQMNSLGFNALRVPRTDYVPNAVLVQERSGQASLFGTLDTCFDGVVLPGSSISGAGEFAGASTASYKRKTALKIASDWLQSATDLSAAFGGAKRITFRFADMRILVAPLSALITSLLDAEPSATLLGLSEARLFVITEVLQAKEFLFLAEGESSQSVAVSGAAIDPATLKIEGNIDAAKAGSGLLVFKAATHHTIGFKAHEIELFGGEFRLIQAAKSTGLSHMTESTKDYLPVLLGDLLL